MTAITLPPSALVKRAVTKIVDRHYGIPAVDGATADEQLAQRAEAIKALAKRTIADAIEIGHHLIEAKKLCGHGNWLPWLNREFGWSEDTAERFIRVHDFVAGLSDSATVRNLVLTLPVSSVYLLAAPSTPEPAKTEIIERAAIGAPIAVAEVKRVVDTAKGRKPSRRPRKRAKGAEPSPQTRGPPPRDDIGPDSAAEAERLRVVVEELQADKRRLEIKIRGLESEVEELRAKLKAGGDMSFPEFQIAIKKYEETVEVQRGIIARLENEKLRAGVGPPPADDGLDIPGFLDRTTQGAAS